LKKKYKGHGHLSNLERNTMKGKCDFVGIKVSINQEKNIAQL